MLKFEERSKQEIAEIKETVFGESKIFGENNKVKISGTIIEELEYSHNVLSERFYKTKIRVRKRKKSSDIIPVIVPGKLKANIVEESLIGKYVEISGEYHSYNSKDNNGDSHLDLFVFAKKFEIDSEKVDCKNIKNLNYIYLDGYVCKNTVFRLTPLCKKITDVFVAVNRRKGGMKSDYIPCIAWKDYAKYADKLKMGDRILLIGRINSRVYLKRKYPETMICEYREAYEVSITKIVKVSE